MPINPAIAMGVRGVELADPLAQYGRAAAIQSAQQQNQLAQLQMQQAMREQESTNALNRAYAEAYNTETGEVDINRLRRSLSTGGFGSKLPGIEKTFGELQQQRLARRKLEGEIAGQAITQATAQTSLIDAKLKQARSFLDTIDPTDPTASERYIAWHEANHRDSVLGPLLESRGVTADQSRAQIAAAIQKGPQAFAQLLAQSKLGTEKFMELNKPQYMAQDTGATTQVIALPGLGLGSTSVVPGSTATKTATIGDITAQQRLAFDQQKFAWEQANPGNTIQQLEDGTIVAINNRTGVARPVTMGAPSAPAGAPAAAAQGTNALAPGAADANALAAGAAAPSAPAVRGSTVAAQRLAFERENAAQRMAFDQQKFAWEQANPGKTIQQLDDGRIVAINNRTGVATPVTMGELGAPARGSTVAAQTLEFQRQKFAWEQANPGKTIQQLDDGRYVAINNRTGVATPVTMGELGAPARGSTVAAQRLAFDQQKFAWERANPGFELKEQADGTVVGVNKRTLQAFPVTLGGAAPGAVSAPSPVAPGAAAPGAAANAARSAGAPAAVPAALGAAAPGEPLKGRGRELAVSEQQASYNLGRILDAAKTINEVIKKEPGALKPGVLEAAPASVGLSGTANVARSAQRQIVYGAQRDALDAMLYLSTGAAYNREQLDSQMAAYIPAFTDKADAVEDKRKRMLRLIDSAKVRAGRAWTPEMDAAVKALMQPGAGGQAAPASGATGNWSVVR